MRNIALFLLPFLFFVSISYAAQSIVIVPTHKDAFAYFSDYACAPSNCAKANINYGNYSVIHIASYHLDTRGVIGFDLSSLKFWDGKGSSVVDAKLYFPPLARESIAYVSTSCAIRVYPMDHNWGEKTITAKNYPFVNKNTYFSVYDEVDAAPNSIYVDITNYVRGKITSTLKQFAFSLESGGTNCALPSREVGQPTYVRITYNSSGSSVSCGNVSIACESGDACCDDILQGLTCYNTSTHGCFSGSAGLRICAKTDLPCADVCYNPQNSVCLGGNKLCPAGWDLCNGVCYDTSSHDCVDNGVGGVLLCPEGNGVCNGACYDQTAYDCFDDVLCQKGFLSCGAACYSPSFYTCNNGVLQQK